MRLFHFCAAHMAASILRQGLTRGFVLTNELPPAFDYSYRWLTTNKSFNQSWAEGSGMLPYRRDEVRLTIEIPKFAEQNVLKWKDAGPILTPCYQLLSAFGDPENWRLYRGNIAPGWIVRTAINPRNSLAKASK